MRQFTREIVITAWARKGLEDFYLAFFITDESLSYCNYFYHQSIEMIGKAYLLGAKEVKYKSMAEAEAKREIDRLAKDMGHGLKNIVEELISYRVLPEDALTKTYAKYDSESITGEKILDILDSAFNECRYPLLKPAHEKYKMLYSLASHDVASFAKHLTLQIIKRIDRDFNITFTRTDFSPIIKDPDWKRFCSTFGLNM